MERIEIDGNLPVDAGRLLASEEFTRQFAGLVQALSQHPSWSGFDDSKAKELWGEIQGDWKAQAPLTQYREAQNREMSLSEYFETIDPSPRDADGNLLVPCDAFERQVSLAMAEIGGRFGDTTLDQFYRGAPAILVPEMLRRWVEAGVRMKLPSVDSLIATTSKISSSSFKPVYIPTGDIDTETDLGAVGSGGGLPRLRIQYRDKDVDSQEFGRVVDVSYRILQHSPMSKIQMIFKFVGLNLATSLIGSIWTTLKDGDGASDAISPASGSGSSEELLYADVISTFLSVDEVFEVNAIIARKAVLVDVLTLAQFKDPEAGFNFQRTGRLSAFRPLGSQLYRYDSATDHYLMMLDTRWAIEKGVEQTLTLETDKLIDQRFESTAITEAHAYAILMDGARAALDFS